MSLYNITTALLFPFSFLLPSSQSAHPKRLSAEEAHRVLKSDIPPGTNPATFTTVLENIENLKAFVVDLSKAMPLTQITTMLLSWETVHMKWKPYIFLGKVCPFVLSACRCLRRVMR